MNARLHSRPRSLEQETASLQEEICSQLRAVMKQESKPMVEQALEQELTEHPAARSHGRTAEHRGYPNGLYRRRLLSRHGEIPDLPVPRAEEAGVDLQELGRHQRPQLEIDKTLTQLFLAGISTPRLPQPGEPLYNRRASATTISQTTTHLAEELEQYRTAPLPDEEVEFLFLDGITERVRPLRAERKILLRAVRREGNAPELDSNRHIAPLAPGDIIEPRTRQQPCRVHRAHSPSRAAQLLECTPAPLAICPGISGSSIPLADKSCRINTCKNPSL